MNGLFSSVSGGAAQELWLDKVTNNLANLNTPGFKGDYPSFESVFVNVAEGSKRGSEPSSNVVLVKAQEGVNYLQGHLKNTENPFDLAIEGSAFFVIDTPDGERYTRNGSFSINDDGVLATADGFPVVGDGGNIRIRGSEMTVGADGRIEMDGEPGGKIRMVAFEDVTALQRMGGSLFEAPQAARKIAPEGSTILQGYLEMSNVNVVSEMTRLVNISRSYEAFQKAISSIDDARSRVINEVGRIA